MPERRHPSPLQSIVAALWCCAAMSAAMMRGAYWSQQFAADFLYSTFLPGVVAAYIVWRLLGPVSNSARGKAIVQGAVAGAAMPVPWFMALLLVNVTPHLFRPHAEFRSSWSFVPYYANHVLNSEVLFYMTCCALPAATIAGAIFVAYGVRPATKSRTRVRA